MDCNMPIKNGFDASRELKDKMKRNEISFIPIIACAAYHGKDFMEKCFSCGMDDFLSKPITTQNLLNIIQKFCPKKIKSENSLRRSLK